MMPYAVGRASDLHGADRLLYRALEILPGFLAWLTIAGVFVCSFLFPSQTAIFIIIFDVYWLVKTIYLSLHLRYGYSQTRKNLGIDWHKKLQEFPWHLVILPTYQEPSAIIAESLEGLKNSRYPKDKMIVVLAQEQRAGHEHNRVIQSVLKERFGKDFFCFVVTEHPDGIAGEVAGKGANITWAGRTVVRDIIDPLSIPHASVLVSVFDIDTVVDEQFLSRLTYVFLTTNNRNRASYQPIPFFTNNIWEAPAFARVVAFSSTFWQTIQQARPENLITFSSHSMPLTAVVDIGFWQTNMVNEDSRVFWQCYLRYQGDYSVVPLYYPVSMDANTAPTLWRTMVNVYKQHRRWGYGAENIPYFLFGFLKQKGIPPFHKIFYTFTILEGFWSWATNAIILFVLGWLPGFVGGPGFNLTVLSYNHTQLSHLIMRLALLALITPAVLSLLTLPPRPPHFGRFRYAWMFVQWIMFPVTTIVFGSLPGLEAQTRLMLGKYMGFWVTPKHRPAIQNVPSSASARARL